MNTDIEVTDRIDLPSGRYYARWLEKDQDDNWRLRCNCGYDSPWFDKGTAGLLLVGAEAMHGRH